MMQASQLITATLVVAVIYCALCAWELIPHENPNRLAERTAWITCLGVLAMLSTYTLALVQHG